MVNKILVCEDEDAIRDFIVINLKRAGYEVVDCPDGETGIEVFEKRPDEFVVALLDIMMPGIDGLTVCKRIREISKKIGIIMLSAKGQEMDKVGALMIGADDYVTKPFSPSELTARVDAICRRIALAEPAPEQKVEYISGPFRLNLKSRSFTRDGNLIDLTQVEFQLMEFFMKNPNVAFDRNEILQSIWGDSYFGDVKIVDVNIRRLRMKIEADPSNPDYLSTVWGFGYKWIESN